MAQDFTNQIRNRKNADPRPAEKGAAETFRPTNQKEPVHRTTINLPVSVYEELRRAAFEYNTSMNDLLIDAWKNRNLKN